MIDIIGLLHTPLVMSEDGLSVVSGGVELPGWHVNVSSEYFEGRPDLVEYQVTPSSLRRVWSGDDPENPQYTIALRFASEEEANVVLSE